MQKLGAFFLDIIEVVVFAIAIFLFVYLLIMQPHKIKGDSMQPNYPNGEYLLTDKISYRFNDPQRGDVIVFEAPGANGDEFIKRIIGLPGEKIKVEGGKVYINGKILKEEYLSPTLYTSSGAFLTEGKEYLIPPNNYIVFGDNRIASSDSRSWGPVSRDKIRGKAFFVYWPPQSFGSTKKVSYSL